MEKETLMALAARYFWFSLAALQGDVQAKQEMKGLEDVLSTEQIAAIQKRAQGWKPSKK